MGGFGSLGPTEQGSFLAYKHVVLNKIDVCVLASMGYMGESLCGSGSTSLFPSTMPMLLDGLHGWDSG
jgi:hypothetical protein